MTTNSDLSRSRLRRKKLLQKRVGFLLYELFRKEIISSCSVSYSEMSKKGDVLRIYLNFQQNQQTTIFLLEQCSSYIKRKLAASKDFPLIPKIIFLIDKKLTAINELDLLLS